MLQKNTYQMSPRSPPLEIYSCIVIRDDALCMDVMRLQQRAMAVLVLVGAELIFLLVAGMVLCCGLRM